MILDFISRLVTAENRMVWQPNGACSCARPDMKPNVLTLRLNVNAGRLMQEYGIHYEKAEPTLGDLSDLYLSLPKRDDGDGRDDVSGAEAVSKTPSPSSRPSRSQNAPSSPRHNPQIVPRTGGGNITDFLRIWTAGCFVKQNRWPCRICNVGATCKHGRGFRRSRKFTPCPPAAHGTLQPVQMKVS